MNDVVTKLNILLKNELLKNAIDAIAIKKDYKIHNYSMSTGTRPNIWGIRSDNPDTIYYNDAIILFYAEPHIGWQFNIYQATTTPSNKTLENPVNPNGCAILVEGQYSGMWKDGNHKGYDAFVQAREIPVYRDNNRDDRLDFNGEIQTGWWGINGHRNSAVSDRIEIGLYSAGCQVWAKKDEFEECRKLAKELNKGYITYDYTLINIRDINAIYNNLL